MAGPQLSVELTGDEVKLWKALEKVRRQSQEVEKGFEKVGKSAGKAGKEAEGTFGPKALSQIKNYAGGMLSVASAIAMVTDAYRMARQEGERAKQITTGLNAARRSLSQISTPDASYSQLEKRADAAAVRYGVERDVARRVLFSAVSENFTADYESVLAASPSINPQSAATVAGQVPALFNNKLSPSQSINAVLTGARQSRLDFEQMAAVLPTAAQGGAQINASPAETIGVLSVLASKFGNESSAATSIRSYAGSVAMDPALQKLGFVGSVERIQQMSEKDRESFLGSNKELRTAYTTISSELDRIKQQTQLVQNQIVMTGTDKSTVSMAVAERESDPVFRAMRNADIQRLQNEIATEQNLSVDAFSREAARNRIRNSSIENGGSPMDRWIDERTADILETGGASANAIETTVTAKDFLPIQTPFQTVADFFRLGPKGMADRQVQRGERLMQLMEQQNKPSTLAQPDADR